MSTPAITLEELLSVLTGEPSQETLVKIDAALSDPNSEIHAYLRSLENFFKPMRDPNHIDWQACIFPPEAGIPDENEQRTEIRQALGDVFRSYWRPGAPLDLPPNRTLVDAVCARLDWFENADNPQQLRVYEIVGENVKALRQETITTVANSDANQDTRSSATHLAGELAKRDERLAHVEESFPDEVRAFKLADDSGRLYPEIGKLMGIPDETAFQYVRIVAVELNMRS
jgi:hypothetical protein